MVIMSRATEFVEEASELDGTRESFSGVVQLQVLRRQEDDDAFVHWIKLEKHAEVDRTREACTL